MEKRIELEKRGRPAEEIKELNLDNCRATQIEGLNDDFVNLESLSLINVGLTTLKGFPNLPNLRKLELSDNRIPGGLNNMSGCPKLTYLNLSGNKIKDIETLEPLKSFSELKNLDLFNCEVTTLDNYRDKVFEFLEGLQYLDGYDRNNDEAEEDEDDDGEVDGEDGADDGEDGEVEEEVSSDDDDEGGEEDGVVDVDDSDDDDADDSDGDLDDEDEEVGLSYLAKDDISDDEEGEDFEPGSGGVEEALSEEDEEEGEAAVVDEDAEGDDASRGVKRKLEDEEDAA